MYRAAQRPYRALFERKWGAQAFAIEWPPDVEQVCNQPGPPPANDPMPVHLTELDRGRAAATFDQMAQSIAGYEASAEVTPFTSKFDAVLAGKAQFTPQEQAGYALFRGGSSPGPPQGAMQQLSPRRCSQILPQAISERPQIRYFLTMLSNNPMHEATPPTRPD